MAAFRDTQIHDSELVPAIPEDTIKAITRKETDNLPEPPGYAAAKRKIQRWIKQAEKAPIAVFHTVTPALSAALLALDNTGEWHNRPQSEKGIRRYIKAMQLDNWILTGETMVVSDEGNFIQGQHRARSSWVSGCSFPCLLVFGIPQEAYKYLDTGVRRTAGHVFSMEEVPNYNHMAAGSRLLYSYLSDPAWGGKPVDVDNEPLLNFYYEHERLQESYSFARGASDYLSISFGIFVHYICAQKNRELANDLFKKIKTGVGFERKFDPPLTFRKKIDDSVKASYEISQITRAAFAVKAWNALRAKRQLSLNSLRWRAGTEEAFPRAI